MSLAICRVVVGSPLGALTLTLQGGALASLDYGDFGASADDVAGQPYTDALDRYFCDPGISFLDLSFVASGTPFQQRVWAALSAIPAGQTLTYGQLAQALGSSARAVGQACRHNPIPILVPCHRVLAAQGLGGYSGYTDGVEMSRKRWLLRHEGMGLA